MFKGFANIWTPAVELREVGREPLRLEIAGEAAAIATVGGTKDVDVDAVPA